MKRSMILAALLAVAVSFGSGCSTVGETEAGYNQGKAKKACELLLVAFCGGDEKRFFAQLPQGASGYTKKNFIENRALLYDKFGNMESFRFLTELEGIPPLHTMVYAVRFKRKGSDGKNIFQEVMFRALVGQSNGHYRVYVFGFL